MDAQTAGLLRKLITRERIAHLGTLRGGAPMVSMTLFMPEQDLSGFYVSVAESDDGRADPFTLMRITVRGEAVQIPQTDELRTRWLERFPQQAINFELADFSFWRIAPRDARFVAGFGRIHNVSATELKTA